MSLLVGLALLVFLIVMDHRAVDAFFPHVLVPSQVSVPVCRHRQRKNSPGVLVPSQVSSAATAEISVPVENETGVEVTSSVLEGKRQRRRRRRKKAHMKNGAPRASRNSQKLTKTKRKRRVSGNLPDVHWRAIPMDHLRKHPHFEPLPHSETIEKLSCLEDVRRFRQGSWQWEALHEGRCTTSQAVSALGLLEPQAGQALGVPSSWERDSMSAFRRLQKPALRTLEELNRELCEGGCSSIPWRELEPEGPVWATRNGGSSFPFAAKYLRQTTVEERHERRVAAEQYTDSDLFMSVRFSWGNAQEATALLTALNYLWKQEPQILVKEVGMCGAGLSINSTTEDSSLVVGATPDAIICYPDGKIEALEVKNHCPFVPSSWIKHFECSKNYSIRNMAFRRPSVPPIYIPQLMLEMMCIGPACRSAVMVRQTATNGAVILRIHRNDEWVEEMMYWLNRFQSDFVETGIPPPKDFFWDDGCESGERYRRFIYWTRKLGKEVEVLDHVNHRDIQRVMRADRSHTSLFLD